MRNFRKNTAKMILQLINQAILAGLFLFGFYVVSQNMRTFLFPQKSGTIVSIGKELNKSVGKDNTCKNCTLLPTEPGKSTIPLSIRLYTGETCTAEISPCCICIDRMKIGDRVGVTKIGSRIIAQKIGRGVYNREAA